MGQQVKRGGGIPIGNQGIKPDLQTGTSPANAIRASRTTTLHKQAVCKTANPSDLHAAESCFPGDVHVRVSLTRTGFKGDLFCTRGTCFEGNATVRLQKAKRPLCKWPFCMPTLQAVIGNASGKPLFNGKRFHRGSGATRCASNQHLHRIWCARPSGCRRFSSLLRIP